MRNCNGSTGVILASLLFASLLSGCTTPGPAPVVSREKPNTLPVVGEQQSHRVRPGETLYSISWQHGLDFRNVATWNRIAPPYSIYPGQRILLTPPKWTGRTKPSPKRSPVKRVSPPVAKSGSGPPVPPPKPVKTPPAPKSSPAPEKTVAANTGPLKWRWPVKGTIASSFSPTDPSRKGIDIAGRLGQTVVASEAGRVVYAGNGLIGYGRLVILKHNKNYLSAYGYNRRLLVKEGDKVKRGSRLAEMGKDIHGKPRLHFEIRRNGTPVNPMKLLPRSRK